MGLGLGLGIGFGLGLGLPAAIASRSISVPPRMTATATGWVMYGSPERRFCPWCASSATSSARRTFCLADGRR